MNNKKSFILYCDLIHTFDKLNDDEAGKLIKHILSYVNDENPISDNRVVEITFEPIKQQLKRDLILYKEVIKQKSEAGKKGMETRWGKNITKDNPVIENITNDNGVINSITNITDNGIGNDSGNEEKISKDEKSLPFKNNSFPNKNKDKLKEILDKAKIEPSPNQKEIDEEENTQFSPSQIIELNKRKKLKDENEENLRAMGL